MKIKVCGMRDGNNIRRAEALGADFIGFIFYEKSPRCVKSVPDYLPQKASRVGVFVNAAAEDIVCRAKEFGLDYVQLHGDESPDCCKKLSAMLPAGCSIIKALQIADPGDLDRCGAYEDCADMFLFDTKCSSYGGSGSKYDWSLLEGYSGPLPFLLSGGIGPDDAAAVKAFHHPKCIGIDLNSRFETAPAQKDTEALAAFLKELKSENKMNRINQLFQSKHKGILSIYFCAGHPTLESTAETIETLAANGIEMIEIGMPFSDPMADGPVIQDASTKALRNGMSLRVLFSQLKDIRERVSIPLIAMGYLNPIMHFGFENFCSKCAEVGIDGMIIPDLPFKDYLEDFKPVADRYNLRIIMLITPETSQERIRFIDEHTDGFIYMVSSASTTGAQKEFDSAKQAYFSKINAMNLRNPRMIGFGISNRQTLESAMDNAAGAIIGSKFVTLYDRTQNAKEAIDLLYQALEE